MKYVLLLMMMVSMLSCASRSPSSTAAEDIEEGINAEYYGSPVLR